MTVAVFVLRGRTSVLTGGAANSAVATPRLSATDADAHSGTEIVSSSDPDGARSVARASAGSWLRFDHVSFGTRPMTSIQARVSSTSGSAVRTGRIEVHLDSLTSPAIATLSIASTGGRHSWQSESAPMVATTGGHSVFLVFAVVGALGAGNTSPFVDLDWVRFIQARTCGVQIRSSSTGGWSWPGTKTPSTPQFIHMPARAPGGGAWGDSVNSYSDSAVRVNNAGQLVITAKRVRDTWVSGHVYTQGRSYATYGYISARIKIPSGTGLWPAFWLIGACSRFPGAGPEIDVMENVKGRDHGTAHVWGTQLPKPISILTSTHSTPNVADGHFHIYSVNWTPTSIEWFLDGIEFGRSSVRDAPTGTWSFDQPHYLILSLAVGGAWPGSPTVSTPASARMVIDWVRVTAPKSHSCLSHTGVIHC